MQRNFGSGRSPAAAAPALFFCPPLGYVEAVEERKVFLTALSNSCG